MWKNKVHNKRRFNVAANMHGIAIILAIGAGSRVVIRSIKT